MGVTRELTQARASRLPSEPRPTGKRWEGRGGKDWNPTVIKSHKGIQPQFHHWYSLFQKAENHRPSDYQVPWSCTSLGGQNQSFSGFVLGGPRDTCPGKMFPTHCFLCKRNYHIDLTPCPSHWVVGELLAVILSNKWISPFCSNWEKFMRQGPCSDLEKLGDLSPDGSKWN